MPRIAKRCVPCIECGFDLRAQVHSAPEVRCPECGVVLDRSELIEFMRPRVRFSQRLALGAFSALPSIAVPMMWCMVSGVAVSMPTAFLVMMLGIGVLALYLISRQWLIWVDDSLRGAHLRNEAISLTFHLFILNLFVYVPLMFVLFYALLPVLLSWSR